MYSNMSGNLCNLHYCSSSFIVDTIAIHMNFKDSLKFQLQEPKKHFWRFTLYVLCLTFLCDDTNPKYLLITLISTNKKIKQIYNFLKSLNHLCIPYIITKIYFKSQNHLGWKQPRKSSPKIILSNLLTVGPHPEPWQVKPWTLISHHFPGQPVLVLKFLNNAVFFCIFFPCLHSDRISPEATSSSSLLSFQQAALRILPCIHLLHKYLLDTERLSDPLQGFSSCSA